MQDIGQRYMCYYGYKFEQFCTATGDELNNPVNDCCAYCITYRTKLGNYRLLLSGEVDCQVYLSIHTYMYICEPIKIWL